MMVKIKDMYIPESCKRCPMAVMTPQYGERRCFVTDSIVDDADYCYERHPECPMEETED